ncbi:MAG: hypothetical protein ACPLXP_00515 [Microgenomates group bacterium]
MPSEIIILFKTIVLLFLFLFLSFLIFFLPGFYFAKKISSKLRGDEQIVLSYSLGFIIFLLGYILASLVKIHFLLFFVLFLWDFYLIFRFKTKIFRPFLELKKEKFLIFLLFLGTLAEGFISFPNGFSFKNGHLYWSAQGHDGLWHVAIIEAIKKSFPPQNPLYAGIKLYNYHYFSDMVMAGFSKFFPFFSVLDLYFRFFPFLICFLIGFSAYSFLTTWTGNKKIGLWGVFFSYFVGSFGYIVLLIQKRGFLAGETIFWAAQGNTIIGNPPHAFCYILFPAFFLTLYHYLQKPSYQRLLLLFLLGGFLAGFKVSAGVALSAGLIASALFFFVFQKNRNLLLPALLLSLTNFTVFKTLTKQGESFLIFQPWWFIRTMVVAPDRLNWIDLELRRQFYLNKGGIRAWFRILQFEGTAFLIFLIGNLGTRTIGFLYLVKNLLTKAIFKNPILLTLCFSAATAFVIPLLFVQKGVAYNLIQFMQYFLLIFGFFAAISIGNLASSIKSNLKKIIFVIIFIFLSIPTVAGNLYKFYGKNPLALVSNQEIGALNFLKQNSAPNDIILTKPFDRWKYLNYPHQPWPISVWSSTAYVSAYTSRQTYLTDEGQLKILGIDPEERLQKINLFFDPKTSFSQKESFLNSEKINFIYLRKEECDTIDSTMFSKLNLEKVYENQEVLIYAKKQKEKITRKTLPILKNFFIF